jgi:putative PIN family toxin of toxin-antitoxin system
MIKLRIVLDTNVLISGLLSKNSIPQQAFDYAFNEAIILQSKETYQELAEVLTRSKFDRYISLEKRVKFLNKLTTKAEIIEVFEAIHACRDPRDNKFLELAVNGEANYIITGDNDLLILHPFRAIPVLTPQAFLSCV